MMRPGSKLLEAGSTLGVAVEGLRGETLMTLMTLTMTLTMMTTTMTLVWPDWRKCS